MTDFSEKVLKVAEPAEPLARPANEWGLASLLLGGVLVLMAPLMMVVMALAAGIGGPHWGASDIRVISLVFSVPLLCLVGLSILGIVAAVNGMRSARQRNLAGGLAVTGLVVCIVALLFSLINLVASFVIAQDLMRFKR